jgi:hypothetical protein
MLTDLAEENLGDFEVTSGKVIVADPCYSRGTWCMGDLEVVSGTWHAVAITADTDWHRRVIRLVAWHKDHKPLPGAVWYDKEEFSLGVDSGQAGIFCDSVYPVKDQITSTHRKDAFYSRCCEATLPEQKLAEARDHLAKYMREHDYNPAGYVPMDIPKAGVVPGGVVSSSGYGDGSYACHTRTDDDGKAVAIFLEFIPEFNEEEESPEEEALN